MGLYNRNNNSSRLASLSEGSRTASYARLNNSNRLSQLSYSTGELSVDYTYDQKLRLLGKTNTPTRVFYDNDQVVEYGSKQWLWST